MAERSTGEGLHGRVLDPFVFALSRADMRRTALIDDSSRSTTFRGRAAAVPRQGRCLCALVRPPVSVLVVHPGFLGWRPHGFSRCDRLWSLVNDVLACVHANCTPSIGAAPSTRAGIRRIQCDKEARVKCGNKA
jgi:hypothetical protein